MSENSLKNACFNFPNMYSHCLFCLSNSPEPKDIKCKMKMSFQVFTAFAGKKKLCKTFVVAEGDA